MGVVFSFLSSLRVVCNIRSHFIHNLLSLGFISQVLALKSNKVNDSRICTEVPDEAKHYILAIVKLIEWEGVIKIACEIFSERNLMEGLFVLDDIKINAFFVFIDAEFVRGGSVGAARHFHALDFDFRVELNFDDELGI